MTAETITFQIDIGKALQKIENFSKNNIKVIQQAVMDSGFYVEKEVKESIAGRRGEPRSVDTGHFMQSVETIPMGFAEVMVHTQVEYARHLEEGTRYIQARQHFANTYARTKKDVRDLIAKRIAAII